MPSSSTLYSAFLNSLLYAPCSIILNIFVVAVVIFVIAFIKYGFNNVIYYFIIVGIAISINLVALMEVIKV